jgi:hypothetical protein
MSDMRRSAVLKVRKEGYCKIEANRIGFEKWSHAHSLVATQMVNVISPSVVGVFGAE